MSAGLVLMPTGYCLFGTGGAVESLLSYSLLSILWTAVRAFC